MRTGSAASRVASITSSWIQSAARQPVRPASQALHAARVTAPSQSSPSPMTLAELDDSTLVSLLLRGAISPHKLEEDLGDPFRAVHLRRLYTAAELRASPPARRTVGDVSAALAGIPEQHFDAAAFYKTVLNTNCEAVIGYIPYPLGIVGPLPIDGRDYRVPLATTEGALIASTNRGCAAIRQSPGGASTVVTADGMSRAPLVAMPSLAEAGALKEWFARPENYKAVADAFASTSRFGRLQSLGVTLAGRNAHLRFTCSTGDAMGMNMITKGVSAALELVKRAFPAMRVLALSGNMCTDKKPSAVNWVQGRGKSVAAEVRIPGTVLTNLLKTSAAAMCELNIAKNLVGSALAGSVGGFNAHASNVLTAIFLATGQDPAQNVESSNCLTLMEVDNDSAPGEAPGLVVSVTMPCVEVGTVGGGTSLPAQSACLELLGLRGANATTPGANAEGLARVVAATVLAGEISLMSAHTSNDLINSHLRLNRKGGGGEPKATPGAITPAIAARLLEMRSDAAVGAAATAAAGGGDALHASPHASRYHPHSQHTTLAGSVPGGAPAGAHGHPLHLATHAAPLYPSAHASPGRRYFAAPTSHSHVGGGVRSSAILSAKRLGLGAPAALVFPPRAQECNDEPVMNT